MPDHLLRPATEKFSFQNTGAIEHLLTGYEGKLGLLDPKKEMLMTEGNLLSERSFISSQKIFVMNFISNKQLIAIWLQQQNNTW